MNINTGYLASTQARWELLVESHLVDITHRYFGAATHVLLVHRAFKSCKENGRFQSTAITDLKTLCFSRDGND